MSKPLRLGLLVISCALARPGLADMITRVSDPAVTDRFYTGAGKAFLGAAYNWSGVGNTAGSSGEGRWATMISPSFFVSATHYAPGGTVTFNENNNPSGASHTYTIAAGMEIHNPTDNSDLYLGMLKAPISASDNIHFLPIATTQESPVGSAILNVGDPFRVGTNTIDDFRALTVGPSTGQVFDYLYNTAPTSSPTLDYLQGGDSGGPSFVVVNGQLALIGVHWYISGSSADPFSGDTYVPAYIAALDAAMAELGSSERVTVAGAVPEPSSLVLALVGAVGLGMMARRKSPRVSAGAGSGRSSASGMAHDGLQGGARRRPISDPNSLFPRARTL